MCHSVWERTNPEVIKESSKVVRRVPFRCVALRWPIIVERQCFRLSGKLQIVWHSVTIISHSNTVDNWTTEREIHLTASGTYPWNWYLLSVWTLPLGMESFKVSFCDLIIFLAHCTGPDPPAPCGVNVPEPKILCLLVSWGWQLMYCFDLLLTR